MRKYKSAEELYGLLCSECRKYIENVGAPMRCKICEDEIDDLSYFDVASLAKVIYRRKLIGLKNKAS
jgi:hypothetical protein